MSRAENISRVIRKAKIFRDLTRNVVRGSAFLQEHETDEELVEAWEDLDRAITKLEDDAIAAAEAGGD